MTRPQAERELHRLFGFSRFHDLQWEVIQKLLAGNRVLFVEKTGFGKSLCFQFPATQMEGVTIVFSPLIALMRDQIKALTDKNIRAAAIHSNQEPAENEEIIKKARNNELDILYIAPERMENAEWIKAAREMKIAMVVIDEAHCISVWGQSFRPNYRRIVNLVKLLPRNFPVLATTATATLRIQKDIIEQVGDDLIPIRGRLLRANIGLFVVKLQSEDEKFYWLAHFLPRLKKSGIIYTGTQSNTEVYSNWLQFLKINSTAYSGRLDAESRKRIENDFMSNQFDCVVSTNALGMGIDKSDIRFIIHTQITQSPIHYYQEIGRAGRDGKPAFAILLYNPNKDRELPTAFIEGHKPSKENYEKVIAVTKTGLYGRNEIIRKANLKQTQVTVILADLIDQKIIHEQLVGNLTKYFFNPEGPPLDLSSFEKMREAQFKELEKMIAYTDITSCRMQYLCNYLGDDIDSNCGSCDNDINKFAYVKTTPEIERKLFEFRETYFPILEVETKRSHMVNGIAASYYGVSNVGAAIHHSKYKNGGDFPDWLLTLTLKAYYKNLSHFKFDLILYVPPTESGDLVKNFAIKISKSLQIPISHHLRKAGSTQPQKIFRSAISKKDNVKDKFIIDDPSIVMGKTILLVDDIFDSGYTLKEIGLYLTNIGAEIIVPLVIAKTVGGDIRI